MRALLISLLLLLSGPAMAQVGFTTLTDADFENIIEDFSSLFNHTSVSGAAGLGDVFGFEFGLIAGVADTPGIDDASQVATGNKVDQLPHGGVYAAVTFPYGITGEVNFLPEIEAEDADLTNQSIAVKWTFSKMLDWPVDVAAKVSHTTSEFSFIQGGSNNVKYESTIQSLGFIASKNFLILEPYAGFGFVNGDGELSAQSTVFADAALSDSAKVSGTQFFAGLNVNLFVFKIGVEAGKVFDNTKASVKTSFYF